MVEPVPAKLLARTRKLRREMLILDTSPFCHDECDGEGFEELEHLVHELAHASLLRIPLGPWLTKHVGDALDKRAANEQAHQEACAWLVEFEVFRLLGLLDRLGCWDSCVDEAIVQEGVTEQLMEDTRERWGEECAKHGRALAMILTGDAAVGVTSR